MGKHGLKTIHTITSKFSYIYKTVKMAAMFEIRQLRVSNRLCI